MNKDFYWLMTNLLPANDKVSGCQVFFPDTVFFRGAKPEIIIKSNPRDKYCLVGTRQPKKLALQSIYKDFQNVVRRRKKDFIGPFGRVYFRTSSFARSNSPNDTTSNAGLTRFISSKDLNQDARKQDASFAKRQTSLTNAGDQTTFSLKEMTAEQSMPGERSVNYKDVALIRERLKDKEIENFDCHKEDILRIVTDHGFMNIFQKRAAHEYWKSVIYIQTNVKSKIGCGQPIIVKFFAPLDTNNIDAEIPYDFKIFGSEEDLIRAGDDFTYCLQQCHKMAYYVQKIH